MALKDEVLVVFRARPKETLSCFQVACAVYVNRVNETKSIWEPRFPNLGAVRSCIHKLRKTHRHLTRRRVKTPLSLASGETA